MTEENIWLVLDAWREDRSRVKVKRGDNPELWDIPYIGTLIAALYFSEEYEDRTWFIDGKEVL